MAKVDGTPDPLIGFVPNLLGRKPAEERKVDKGKGAFRVALKEAERSQVGGLLGDEPFSNAELEELLDKVHASGDELKRDQSMNTVRDYKRAVRDFVHYVVERAFSLDEHTSGRNVLKRKKFTAVAVIDEKLERLAAEVLATQKNQLEILRRIDEINGLIVDLVR